VDVNGLQRAGAEIFEFVRRVRRRDEDLAGLASIVSPPIVNKARPLRMTKVSV